MASFWSWLILKKTLSFESSVREKPRGRKYVFMKRIDPSNEDDMRPEYDFAKMKGRVRGKYVERLRKASNIVVLEPEVVEAFPTGEAVNAALRGMLDTAKAVRRYGGLPNKTMQPPRSAAKPHRVPSARKGRPPRHGGSSGR